MTDLRVNDVVQIDPAKDSKWGGCFLTVTEIKSWGVQGFMKIPMESGVAFYRVPYAHIERIGTAEWALNEGKDDGT